VFAIYKPLKSYVPLGRGHLWPQGFYLKTFKSPCPRDARGGTIHDPRNSFEQPQISWTSGFSMPNTNAFQPVVYETEIF